MDGLEPFSEFMRLYDLVDDSHHLLPEERQVIVELAHRRFQQHSADAQLVAIVSRLAERTPDAPKRKVGRAVQAATG